LILSAGNEAVVNGQKWSQWANVIPAQETPRILWGSLGDFAGAFDLWGFKFARRPARPRNYTRLL
jgi:hypothetical protein